MRAFHCSWFSFFIAFFLWFSITPLLGEIQDTLDLDKKQIWNSSIVGVAGTIVMRIVLGPACDKYGARILVTAILCLASIPTGLVGLVNSAMGLYILRAFIGIAGGTFVMCQYWTSRMFANEVVGTANAIVGGWGNLGGGVTQLVMGSLLFPLFQAMYDDDIRKDARVSELAWRTVCVIPAMVGFATGIVVYYISDDAPKGNYTEMKKNGTMDQVSAVASFHSGAWNVNTWLLFVQYGCCFGVELTMNNAAALYFKEEFDLTTESAAAVASIFGWMNLFARALGGLFSDRLHAKWGMRGRLITQFVLLILEGVTILVFANTKSLGGSIVTMVIFSIFVQAAEGSTFGIVPYVNPLATGSVAGIVGAGGSAGGVGFGFTFRQLDYEDAFVVMACTIFASSVLTAFICIKGQSSLFCGTDTGEGSDPSCLRTSSMFVPLEKKNIKKGSDKGFGADEEDPQQSPAAANIL
jgi:NNP family nitrate/nitrite transporter-like MFS transporter